MFAHHNIWQAIDQLAEHNGLSPSGLARRAGLDPTTFNKSKRFAKDGRARWPSTESISKILTVTSTDSAIFFGPLIRDDKVPAYPREHVPLLGFAQAGVGGFFDDGGYPVGHGWEEVSLPNVAKDGDYALRITGDSMLPIYRDGDVIIVSPGQDPRSGDRVVVKTTDGEVTAKVLFARNNEAISLMSFNEDHSTRQIKHEDVEWIARITWASQ